MEKKYRLTEETIEFLGRTLHRIEALRDFTTSDGAIVRAEEKGGWIESENNLSHDGNAWVCGDARVFGNARVCGNARVFGNAWVYEPWHILVIGPIGSRDDYTTFFRGKDGKIYVKCGCFSGDIKEFTAKVKETHGNNHHGKMYKFAIEMAKEQMRGGADA